MVTTKYERRVPEGVDVTRPSIARIYDYLLFGKDNFAADRAAADRLMESRARPEAACPGEPRIPPPGRALPRPAPGIIDRFSQRMAPGSYLAISIGTSDGADPKMLAEATDTYARARMPFTLRSRPQIIDLLEGFVLVEPGLVSLPEWRPGFNTDRTPLNGPTLGAAARLAA